MFRVRLAVALAALSLPLLPATPASAATESWSPTSSSTFSLLDALQRSQGVATDGRIWYFSWQFGLSRVDLDTGHVLTDSPVDIPVQLLLQGDNHIGDIDYARGKIYAGVEDGPGYHNPHIAVFDAATLAFTGTTFTLPQAIQNDGVPWVAADPADGLLLSSEYHNTTEINEYDIGDGHLVRQVHLGTPIDAVQGAKLYGGYLYASCNDATKSVYRIDLATGEVTDVLDPGLPSGTETEGLAFLPTRDGSVMHRLDVAPNRLTVNFRGYSSAPTTTTPVPPSSTGSSTGSS